MPCRYLYFLACLPDLQLGSLHYVSLTGRRIKKFFKRSDDEFIFYDPVRLTSWFPSHLPKSGVTRGLVLTRFCSNSSNADPWKGIAGINCSYVAIILGASVLVWTIASQGLWFYSNCCNADPCKGIAETNWLCCHDSLGGPCWSDGFPPKLAHHLPFSQLMTILK